MERGTDGPENKMPGCGWGPKFSVHVRGTQTDNDVAFVFT